jgi:hypothetical protein
VQVIIGDTEGKSNGILRIFALFWSGKPLILRVFGTI